MKKTTSCVRSLVVVVACALLAPGCGGGNKSVTADDVKRAMAQSKRNTAATAETKLLIVPGKSINGLEIGGTEADVRASWGVVKDIKGSRHNPEPKRRLMSGDVRTNRHSEAIFRDGKVASISSATSAKTAEGVGPGVTGSEMIAKMGKPEWVDGRSNHYFSRGITFQFVGKSPVIERVTVYSPTTGKTLGFEPGVGVGKAKLGDNCTEAIASLGVVVYSYQQGDVVIYHLGPIPRTGIIISCKTGRLAALDLYPPFAGKTSAGISLSSTTDELVAAFGDRLKKPSGYRQGRWYWSPAGISGAPLHLQIVSKTNVPELNRR